AARLAQRVKLVDENDTWGTRLRLSEQITHAAGSDANKHLHEIRAAHAEERYVGLAGDRFGQQRLARPRRADEQYALVDAAAQGLVFLGVFQEIDDLAQPGHRLVDAGDVLEIDLEILLGVQLVPAAAEGQRRTAAGDPAEDQEARDHHREDHHERHED